MKKNKNGITIVSLVITIVVMLILLGVTVTSSINGELIKKAEESNEDTRYAQILEEKEMWEAEKKPADRFGIQTETLEEFVDRLKENGLLTEEEAEMVKGNKEININGKEINF